MSFYAKNFTFDDQSSEMYNLQIANQDEGSQSISSPGSGDIEIVEQFIYKRPVPYFYGVKFTSRLEFPIMFFSEDEINAVDLSYIQYWLFGNLQYKKLAIIQPDTDDFYINCIFSQPQIIRAGNIIYGLSGTCKCDSQFAYTYPKTDTYNYSSPPSLSTISFFNNSHYKGYLYPEITITMNNTVGGSALLTNVTDNNNQFYLAGLSANEIITVDNDLGIIQSSTGFLRLQNFNKNLFRFAPGLNTILVSGNISQIQFIYQFARRFGG